MKKIILISALLFLGSNAFSHSAAITEDEAIAKLNEFFLLLDVKNYEKENISRILTSDVQIIIAGYEFDLDSFDLMIKEAFENIIKTEQILSDLVVSLDHNSAHITYYKKCKRIQTDEHIHH